MPNRLIFIFFHSLILILLLAFSYAVATGVAPTGTPISTLSGAAATNAINAFYGGGSLAAGGTGVAGGLKFFRSMNAVGFVIAGFATLGTGYKLYTDHQNKNKINHIQSLILFRQAQDAEPSVVELKEHLARIDSENRQICEAISRISTFGYEYQNMTQQQQYELGAYVNLMHATLELLKKPLTTLQPKFSAIDLAEFIETTSPNIKPKLQPFVIALCNELYKIDMDDTESAAIFQHYCGQPEILEQFDLTKKI